MVKINLYPIPQGTQYVTAITAADPVSKNDFRVRIAADTNIHGLTESHLSVEDADFVDNSFRGEDAVFEIGIRPPDTGTGDITLKLAANAVPEGNTETTIMIPYSDSERESDWDSVLSSSQTYTGIIEATPNRLYLTRAENIDAFDTIGTELTEERRTLPNNVDWAIPFGNNGYLVWVTGSKPKLCLLSADGAVAWVSDELMWDNGTAETDVSFNGWTLTKDGILVATSGSVILYPLSEINEATRIGDPTLATDRTAISFSNGDVDVPEWNASMTLTSNPETGKIYVSAAGKIYAYDSDRNIIASEILVADENNADRWLAVSNGNLYRWTDGTLYSHDLHTDLPPVAHANVHPIHVRPGETIDLYKFMRPFLRTSGIMAFDVGFDLPYWLELEANRFLNISKDIFTREVIYIKANGINDRGISDTLSFYLIVEPLPAPSWLPTTDICMYESQILNLLEFCEDADTVHWKNGFSVPSELDITDSQISLTGTPQATYTLEVTARKRHQTTDQTLHLSIIREQDEFLEELKEGFKVEIEGIDVSHHLRNDIPISQSLDVVRINEYSLDNCQIVLNMNHESPQTFSSRLTPNFWTQNTLNYGGYLNSVKVYVVYRETAAPNANRVERLIFSGVIFSNTESQQENSVTLDCVEITYLLRQRTIDENAIGIRKLLAPALSSEPSNYEGVYPVDVGLTPALTAGGTLKAYTDRTQLTLKDVVNYPEGVDIDNTAHWTGTALHTQGGALDTPPLLFCKVPYRKKSIGFGLRTLAKSVASVCGVSTEYSQPITETPNIQAFGNVVYDTESGRAERVPVDWIHDSRNNVLYLLLSNRSNRVRDRLIRFDIDTEIYRVLYEFEADRAVHQIATSNFDDFYITTSASIDTDRSEPEPIGREPAAVNLACDAASAFSDTRIIAFHQSFGDTTEILHADATHSPQIGLHYWVGFSNRHYLYSWEGIHPESRSNFKVHANELYYRYATTEAFGVAKVATDGTATALFEKAHDRHFNHLNFDFEVDTVTGEVHLASVNNGTLTLERYVSGADPEVIFSRKSHPDLDGGAFIGVHELRRNGDNFYLIVPFQAPGAPYAQSAGAAVLNWHIHQKQFRLLQKDDFTHWGAYGLTPHEECTYFTETPCVSYKLLPIHPTLDTYDAEEGYNDLSENKGTLKCIQPQHRITAHGNTYFENQAFRGTYARGLSFNDGIHYIFGYGDAERIQQPDNPLTLADNLQWCAFQKEIHHQFDVLHGQGSLYNEVLKYAVQTNSAYFNDRGILNLRDTRPFSARLTESIGTILKYAGANREFPSTGHLYINGEVIGYTSRTDTEFRTLTRNMNGTQPHTQAVEGTEFLYIDGIYSPESNPLSFPLRTSEYFNAIRDEDNLVRLRDTETDIAEKTYRLSVNLSPHDVAWLENLADTQLQRLSNLKNLIKFSILTNYAVRLGDIVYFNFQGMIADSVRIVRLNQSRGITSLEGRSIEPTGVRPVPPTFDPNDTYRTLDGIGDPILIDGNGDHTIFLGDELNQQKGVFATTLNFDADIEDQNHTAGIRIEDVQLPPASGGEGTLSYTLTGLPAGLIFNPITLRYGGVPQSTQTATPVTYTATDQANPAHTRSQTFDITVEAEDTTSSQTFDGREDIFFIDGVGNSLIFKG